MTDDIVTRLRKQPIPHYLLSQAADEIERLRTELFMAEKWRDNYKLALDKYQEQRKNND